MFCCYGEDHFVQVTGTLHDDAGKAVTTNASTDFDGCSDASGLLAPQELSLAAPEHGHCYLIALCGTNYAER